jgi:hypothetical protein
MRLRRIAKIDDVASMVPTSRDTFEYWEGDRRLQIVAELMAKEPSRMIYASSIRAWLPPHESEPLDPEHRRQILARVCKYFELNGQTYQVD